VTTLPSGEQLALVDGDLCATVVEVGAGLRTFAVGERQILDGYSEDEMCPSGRGQVLLPWPNRIQDGAYSFGGQDQQLPLTEPEARNAIHGLVRWEAWTVRERTAERVVLAHVLHPQPGYPFTLDLEVDYALSADGLIVRTRATNLGTDACPFGAGNHPYLRAGGGLVDDLVLRLPASTVLDGDARGIPTGSASVEERGLDFRKPRAIGDTVLDHAFGGLERDADGIVRVELHDPGSGDRVVLWADEAYGYLQVFTGDPLPDVARRSLAVEPMTCPPNAFRTGEALVRLEPGASWTGAWGIDPT
jgi:aldose 1-epimerase